jgi:uncharacterized protein (UPF0210 family)
VGIMTAAAGRDDVIMAVAATGCPGDWLAVRMIAGNGIVAGSAAEFGMSGMTKVFRINIVSAADLDLVSVARDAGDIFADAVAE